MRGLTTGQYGSIMRYMIDRMGGKQKIDIWHVTKKSLVAIEYDGTKRIVPLTKIFGEVA